MYRTPSRPAHPKVDALTVYFDGACSVCVHCRNIFARERTVVPIRWVDCRSDEARSMRSSCPTLADELHVAAPDGAVWIGANAFRMILWATTKWHSFAVMLDAPILYELSSLFFAWVSRRRDMVGILLGSDVCTDSSCALRASNVKHA